MADVAEVLHRDDQVGHLEGVRLELAPGVLLGGDLEVPQRSHIGLGRHLIPNALGLGKQIVGQLLSPQTPADGRQWGLGFELKGQGEAARFRHSGDSIGFKCFVQAFCERGAGVVLMSNGDNGESVQKELLHTLAQQYGWLSSSQGGTQSTARGHGLPRRLALHTLQRYARIVHL